MKLSQLKEASYHSVDPFIRDFFRNLWDPDGLANTPIPDHIDIKQVIDVFNEQFGEPINRDPKIAAAKVYGSRKNSFIQWQMDIPDHARKRSGLSYAYIEIMPRKKMIHVTWE